MLSMNETHFYQGCVCLDYIHSFDYDGANYLLPNFDNTPTTGII